MAAVNAWAAAGCTPDAPEEIEAAEELAAAVSAFDIEAARLANNRMSCREELACFRDTFCLLVTITLIAAILFILNDAGEVRGLPHMPIPSAYECLPPAPHPSHPPTHPTRHPRSAYLHLSSCTARGVTLTFNAAYLSCPYLARAAAQNHNTWMWPALLGFVGCATFIVCCCCLAASYSDNSSTSRAEPRGPVRV